MSLHDPIALPIPRIGAVERSLFGFVRDARCAQQSVTLPRMSDRTDYAHDRLDQQYYEQVAR